MGKNSVQFKCHSCVHCCTEVVCLPTPWDVLRMVKMTGQDPYVFLEFLEPDELDEVEDDDPTWLECDGEKYMMALKRDEEGCSFLDKKTRLCSIYEARPILCRLYPFKVEETKRGKYKGFSLHDDVGCPLHTDGTVPTQPLYKLYMEDDEHQDDYHVLVEDFNKRDYEDKEPDDFLGMFLKYLQNFPKPIL